MTTEQQATWDAWLATMRNGWRFDAAPPGGGAVEPILLAVDAELRHLRTALAASQAREATRRAALEELRLYFAECEDQTTVIGWKLEYHQQIEAIDVALADPSPVADALGRVARASVRAVQAEWVPDRATLDQARIEQRAAVEGLLVVAPHWGEPKEGDTVP